jgi:lipopolysaccharide export system permease protein
MKLLDLYIGRSFSRCFLLVLSGLAFLFTFFEFISQLDDVGEGHYQLGDALSFVLLTVPGRILYLIPESSLLAGIIALGILADHNELLAMRASGMSVRRMCGAVIAAASLPMLGAGILAEVVVPPLEQQARTLRLAALTEADISFTSGGLWARNGPVFIHIGKIRRGGTPLDIDIFEWDPEGRLRVFTHARKADVAEDNRWVLTDVEQRTITNQAITARRLPTLTLASFLTADQMAIQESPPETLSPSDLYRYVRVLQQRGQNPDQYELVFWQKLATPLSTVAMVLLSLTFVFGPTREKTAGFRIMTGAIVGIGMHFLNQILGQLGLVLGVNLALSALLPVAVILCLAMGLLSRDP